MSTLQDQTVVDGDGHVVEDHEAIWQRMPEDYRVSNWSMRSPFGPNDHLHSTNRHFVPEGAFAKVGPEGWIEFLEDVGVERTVLYPSNGLTLGRVVSATGPSSCRAPTTTGSTTSTPPGARASRPWG